VNRGRSKTPALDSFGQDLTELARQGRLDPVIGRSREMEQVLRVLGCRAQNNPLLVGERGVGKAAIIAGLAYSSVGGRAPDFLHERRIVALSLGLMIVHTTERGNLEAAVRAVINEIRRAGNITLFLDDFAALDSIGSLYAGQLLRAAVATGTVPCIAATTPAGYQSFVAKYELLSQRFRPIFVQPTSKEETLAILRGLRQVYEAHHQVLIEDEALNAAVELAERHLPCVCFPGTAVRLLDEAGVLARLRYASERPDWKELNDRLEQLNLEKENAIAEQDFVKAARFRDQGDKLKQEKARLAREWEEQAGKVIGVVDAEVIAEIVSQTAGATPAERTSSEPVV
jgi:ATP-dependent Clp protease ATP-binding subunit ClpC